MTFCATFLHAPFGQPTEVIGEWGLWSVPALGEVVTLSRDGGESAWFVIRVAHHVGNEIGHSIDVFVEPAAFG